MEGGNAEVILSWCWKAYQSSACGTLEVSNHVLDQFLCLYSLSLVSQAITVTQIQCQHWCPGPSQCGCSDLQLHIAADWSSTQLQLQKQHRLCRHLLPRLWSLGGQHRAAMPCAVPADTAHLQGADTDLQHKQESSSRALTQLSSSSRMNLAPLGGEAGPQELGCEEF